MRQSSRHKNSWQEEEVGGAAPIITCGDGEVPEILEDAVDRKKLDSYCR